MYLASLVAVALHEPKALEAEQRAIASGQRLPRTMPRALVEERVEAIAKALRIERRKRKKRGG